MLIHFNLPLDEAFYFNFKGSIYGEIQASMTSGSRVVPKKNFLATLLLPCGKLDSKIKKFTGSDDIGDAPDSMTKAIHAFAHWSLLYSRGHILFCDLQGTITGNDILLGFELSFYLTGALDFKRVMCLFDPQAHTCVLYNLNHCCLVLTCVSAIF
jgi:alpha-kinase family protein